MEITLYSTAQRRSNQTPSQNWPSSAFQLQAYLPKFISILRELLQFLPITRITFYQTVRVPRSSLWRATLGTRALCCAPPNLNVRVFGISAPEFSQVGIIDLSDG